MSKKPSILGGALSGLKKSTEPTAAVVDTEPSRPAQIAIDADDDRPIGVLFRLNPRDHEIVSDYARDLRMSMQELIENAINKMRVADGLAPIEGRPRSKTRRRR